MGHWGVGSTHRHRRTGGAKGGGESQTAVFGAQVPDEHRAPEGFKTTILQNRHPKIESISEKFATLGVRRIEKATPAENKTAQVSGQQGL